MTYRIVICSLLIINTILLRPSNGSLCQPTLDYISGKLQSSKVDIAKAYIQEPESVISVTYDIKWTTLWQRDLASRALTIGLFDEMFVLIENDQLLSIGVDFTPLELLPSKVGLHDVSILRTGLPMKFIKSIIWKEVMYLLICYDANFCRLYTSTESQYFQHQQKTLHQGRPVDATFFIENDSLYLIIATSLDAYPTTSVIYRWTETYMDIIDEIPLKSVVSVVTFRHKDSRILVFSQSAESSFVGSQIYKLVVNEKSGQGKAEPTQFLSTNRPVAMHLYQHAGCTFLLVVTDAGPAEVFWYDGKEFLPWIPIEDIQGPSLINSVRVNDDTFLIVAQTNLLSVYRITTTYYELLEILEIPDVIRIIDMGIWSVDTTISLVLISERGPSLYRVEPLQLVMHKRKKSQGMTKEIGTEDWSTSLCLKKLEAKIKEKMIDVERSRSMWSKLYSASEDVVVDELEADVILRTSENSTVIENLEMVSETQEEIIPPKELVVLLKNLEPKLNKSLDQARSLLQNDPGIKKLVLSSLTVTNNAYIGQLQTPVLKTEFINDHDPKERLKNAISTTRNQTFVDPLKANHVVIENLEMDSLCGIPKDFWLLENDTRTPLKPTHGPKDVQVQVRIENDTVFMTADIFKPDLEAAVLNSVNLSNFLGNLFIPGENQVINGNVIFQNVFVGELSADYVRGVPKEKLLTITTDQVVEDSVYIESLEIQHLNIGKINGIGLSEAARVSQENVIKSKVILNHLTITDELIIDENCDLFKEARGVQVYENVTINGNVVVQSLDVEDGAIVNFADEEMSGYDIINLFSTSWTKSGEQHIDVPILKFENGLTIDELNTEYLNDLKEDDYLYTTAETIPSNFNGMHFEDFVINGSTRVKGEENSFIEVNGGYLLFNERIHFEALGTMNLFTGKYNGIRIYLIMSDDLSPNKSIEVEFPADIKLESMTVNDQLQVSDLHLKTLNNHDFSDILFADEDYTIDSIKTSEFRAAEFRSASARYTRSLEDLSAPEGINLVIDGPLIVENNLQIDELVNNQPATEFLVELSKMDIRINDPSLVIENLDVSEDILVTAINERDFNEFVDKIFSKTKDQVLIGTKTYHRLMVERLNAETINGKRIRNMYFIDEPLIFNGNVFFDQLSADVSTKTVNDIPMELIQGNVSYILTSNITHLNVTGTVAWEENENPNILSNILANAVLADSETVIEAPVVFSGDIQISSIQSEHPVFSPIHTITADAVVDNNAANTMISGKKTFLKNVTVKSLRADNLKIENLETMTVRELNSSMVWRYEDDKVIPGQCVFTNSEIRISQLNVPNLGPGMPNISSLFFISDHEDNYLPNNVHFKKLVVMKNAEVTYLDDVNFMKFLDERVTLTGDHLIESNVRFNGFVETKEIEVKTTVNDIHLEDIVLKRSHQPQVIEGEKIFVADLTINGDLDAVMFNGINMTKAYKRGVLNNESPVITGDLVIEGDIEISGNTHISGTVNGVKLSSLIDEWDRTGDSYMKMIDGNLTALGRWIEHSATAITDNSPEIFHHFEIEHHLDTGRIEDVRRFISITVDGVRTLDIYTLQRGDGCPGLSETCPCRSQHVIEPLGSGFRTRKDNSSEVVYIFQDANNEFTIIVTTNTVSSSEYCTQTLGYDEFTSISWMTGNNSSILGNFTYHPEKINGYLSDAQVFAQDDTVYIVLAMSYDSVTKSHQVDSWIFGLSLRTSKLVLSQKIPTISASAVEVFKIPGKGSYIMIASDAPIDDDLRSSPMSVLYKLPLGSHKFELAGTFYTGGTRRVKSIAHKHRDFLLMDDIQANSVHIYNYEESSDKFEFYQSLYFDARVSFIDAFYPGSFRESDVYVVITTEDDRFFLYQYMMIDKFQERLSKWSEGIIAATPFYTSEARYLVLIARDNSTMYRIIQQGSN